MGDAKDRPPFLSHRPHKITCHVRRAVLSCRSVGQLYKYSSLCIVVSRRSFASFLVASCRLTTSSLVASLFLSFLSALRVSPLIPRARALCSLSRPVCTHCSSPRLACPPCSSSRLVGPQRSWSCLVRPHCTSSRLVCARFAPGALVRYQDEIWSLPKNSTLNPSCTPTQPSCLHAFRSPGLSAPLVILLPLAPSSGSSRRFAVSSVKVGLPQNCNDSLTSESILTTSQ